MGRREGKWGGGRVSGEVGGEGKWGGLVGRRKGKWGGGRVRGRR